MKMSINRLNVSILLAFLLMLMSMGPTISFAADYPNKPIQTIVPFAPGGGADVSQRIFNKYAAPIVGKSMVIVSKPGAGGTTGWAELVRSKPNGYTLSIITPPYNIIPPLVRPKQTGYTLDQITYLCVYGIVPDVLYAKEGGKYKTVKDNADTRNKQYSHEHCGCIHCHLNLHHQIAESLLRGNKFPNDRTGDSKNHSDFHTGEKKWQRTGKLDFGENLPARRPQHPDKIKKIGISLSEPAFHCHGA